MCRPILMICDLKRLIMDAPEFISRTGRIKGNRRLFALEELCASRFPEDFKVFREKRSLYIHRMLNIPPKLKTFGG